MNIQEKRDLFKVQIRRKKVVDKLAVLRATHLQQNFKNAQQFSSDQNIQKLINESLSSKQSLIKNIGQLKSASFHINPHNAKLFFPLVPNLCFIVQNLEDNKYTEQISNKDYSYNEIIIILINISSEETYQWPIGQYLPIIKNLLSKQRQVNTLWFLSNILNQRAKNQQSFQTAKNLTHQLIKYDSLSFCEQRIQKKFQDQTGIQVFTCFVCTFISNSLFLKFQQFKRVLKILESLSNLNLDYVDWFIIQAFIDHASFLNIFNYEALHSKLINKFKQDYIKKKKTKMVLKVLQFFKSYVLHQILGYEGKQIQKQSNQSLQKIKKSNYQRISLNVIPILTTCLQNRAPSIRSQLLQICSMLLQQYFSYIDLQNQTIFRTLSQTLKQDATSILSKYSNKVLQYQLRYCSIFMKKLNEYKISKEIISQFINQHSFLQALSILLREKTEDRGLVAQITQFVIILLRIISVQSLKQQKNDKSAIIYEIRKSFEAILANNLIHQEQLYDKIIQALKLIQKS